MAGMTPEEAYALAVKKAIGSGSGTVSSVNGKTGTVELEYDDLANKPAVSNIAPAYSNNESYTVKQYVLRGGILYKCKTDIPAPGETWNPEHWQQVSIGDMLYLLETGPLYPRG